MPRWHAGLVMGLVLVMAVGGAAPAAEMMSKAAEQQLQTAITHAGAAAGYNSTAQIELHLHYVVNCIEGKSGKDYFAGSGDVCQGMGKGLLTDLQSSGMVGAHALPYVEIAQTVALWGIAQGMRKDVARAKAAAQVTKAALERSRASLK